ncbi:MAG TPA: pyridoxamine 5'-phosphate oxidase [Ornithinimicrobium sp.]|uniref:pyridoxamine 5'-phosphate oxidase n=1 Tax=Ornithinimicrobium sp. TaxID=1977084 RepID=UPI002B4A55A8|nr:pyridoxamine 5'-phosphate oxidase [Ornithinimicrobium sp.]HKJ10773.1 pyridoxamine 5'-phosphate oxidase [Ornithinimicrobium sp.]
MAVHERVDYDGEGLRRADLAPTPYEQLQLWVEQARIRQGERGDVPEPSALSVATVDEAGQPDVRTVLVRRIEPRGIAFFTGLDSAKARQLRANPRVAASFTWPSMFRSVRLRGLAVPVAADAVADYFSGRPWGSRISAWASAQSRRVPSRATLEDAYAEHAARFPDTGRPDDVPVPPRWGGFWVEPYSVEFWAGRSNRLHDRWVWQRDDGSPADLSSPSGWSVHRLGP